ncbi:hypothetical protein [Neorhizobium sp. T6_25]|uniref:hypothetical protein n=1 Tax=Neorhizobium sp. T6_25 TaxID=2093833 RepID=UPI00155E3BEE|nr:hypothetical protein [Neorhizobium sp. T6_25]
MIRATGVRDHGIPAALKRKPLGRRKTIKMNVGTGGGSVTLSSSGKGQMSYRYSFKGNNASATLAKH